MKTKYLDSELQRLSILEKQGALSVFGRETLIEFKAIKQALTIPDVIKPLICCGTCIWMNDGDCDMGEPCIDFRLWETN
jgi:hypothetical protein